ncbi:MAG: hemerythrin family protein [Magnetococcales bacterium]|nr:hemerythrin family protein [Magnetococcales bacterium]
MSIRLAQWCKNLKTGHRDIDKQHRSLFEMFDSFIMATLKNSGDEKLPSLLEFLVKYSSEHFYYEEQYYRRKNYPKFAHHKKEHEVFTQNLRIIKRKCFKESNSLHVQELNKMLGEWFRNHILQEDLAATRWIEENPSDFYFQPKRLTSKKIAD